MRYPLDRVLSSGYRYPPFEQLCPALYHDIRIIAKYILGELEVTGFMPGNKCRFNKKKKVMFVIMYVTGSTGKTEDRSKFLTKLDLFKKHNITHNNTLTTLFMQKMEYFTCIQRSINPILLLIMLLPIHISNR